MRIAVDFDGTIAEHIFPAIGRAVPGAFEYMKLWKEAGATLILWTMRSDGQDGGDGDYLAEAIEFCQENGIEFDSHNEGPGDRSWTTSPKAYANIYVDDAAFGCPLRDGIQGTRQMVDWEVVGPAVLEKIKGSK